MTATATAAPRGVFPLLPPEGVPIRLALAPIGLRFAAQGVDLVLTFLFALSLLLVFTLVLELPETLLVSLFALLFLFLRAPYYVLTELLMAGRTPGKRWLGLRVIAVDGRTLTPTAVVARNLMKEAEVFVPATALLFVEGGGVVQGLFTLGWIAAVLIVPFANRRRQRLGDLIAGTVVVVEPQARLLPELSGRTGRTFVFQPHQLDHYGAYELHTLEQVLRTRQAPDDAAARRRAATLAAIVERIRARIDHADPVAPEEHHRFLEAFYEAQRAHLEHRQLMGERRADKHHRRAEAGPAPSTGNPRKGVPS